MFELPELETEWGELYDIVVGHIESNLMLAAIRLKVFNHLLKPVSAEEVAIAIGGSPAATGYFLDGLAAMDLVTKNGGRYQNAPMARQYLVEGSPTYLGGFFIVHCQMLHVSTDAFVRLVTGGPERPPSEGEAPSMLDIEEVDTTMISTQLAGGAQQAVEIVSGLPEFPSFEKMLDLGGGPGLICCAVVAAHPTMRGVVFDLPAVARDAGKNIREYGMEDRVEVLGGDYNTDSLGEGYDLVWTSGALYSVRDMDRFAVKVYGVLNPGGVWVNLSEGLTHERTKPGKIVLASLFYTMSAGDIMLDRGKVAGSMERAGFSTVESRTVDTHWGQLEVDVARN
jgi:hypothetical protein